MKKEVIDHVVSSFVDFTGTTRKFIVAAVSTPIKDSALYDENFKEISAAKTLSIGFAICNANDTFDEELGLKIAVNKANSPKNKLRMYALYSGMINTTVVKALMEQEIKYFINNPDSHIPGYHEAESKYLQNKKDTEELEAIKNSFSEEQMNIINKLNSYTPEIRNSMKRFINEK